MKSLLRVALISALLPLSTALAQDASQLIPLLTYINQPVEKDPAALGYVVSRCSALYSLIAVKLEPETDPDRQRVRKELVDTAEKFMGKALQSNMTGTTQQLKDAMDQTSKTVVGLGKLYSDRIERQKLLTNNMFDDQLIATDLGVCKTLAAKK